MEPHFGQIEGNESKEQIHKNSLGLNYGIRKYVNLHCFQVEFQMYDSFIGMRKTYFQSLRRKNNIFIFKYTFNIQYASLKLIVMSSCIASHWDFHVSPSIVSTSLL